jgi:hypothetical protein
MSTETQTKESEQLQLPGVDEASGLMDQLYQEAFFGKMAELGFVPQNEKEATAMLDTAIQLDVVEETTDKEASFFQDANSALREVLVENGVSDAPQVQEQEGLKQAAFALAQNPDLYRSVLTLQAANIPEDAE